MSISYKDSGVDIDAGNSLIERIKPHVKSTFTPNVLGGLGGFAGAYELPSGYKNPVLLSATDGVGTKLKLAIESKKLDTVGIDLVAMCVNDLICSFATPMFFLDYYATGKLNVDEAESVIKGIAKGCEISQCSLVGGETAEMPGMYEGDDFDLAGFSVGIAEKEDLTKSKEVGEGDVLIALKSSGVHSNGYSLVRKLFFDKLGMKYDDEFEGKRLIDTLLTPTEIYVKTFKEIQNDIKALAHITGGGIVENLPRVLPEGMSAKVDKNAIQVLPVFQFMSKHVEESEMFRTFNMGVGMVVVASKEKADQVCKKSGGYVIGEIVKGGSEVII